MASPTFVFVVDLFFVDGNRIKNTQTSNSNVLLVIHAFSAYLHLPRSFPSCKTKQNGNEAKRKKMKQIKPKQNVCACAVAKLLLKVTVFGKSRR